MDWDIFFKLGIKGKKKYLECFKLVINMFLRNEGEIKIF